MFFNVYFDIFLLALVILNNMQGSKVVTPSAAEGKVKSKDNMLPGQYERLVSKVRLDSIHLTAGVTLQMKMIITKGDHRIHLRSFTLLEKQQLLLQRTSLFISTH